MRAGDNLVDTVRTRYLCTMSTPEAEITPAVLLQHMQRLHETLRADIQGLGVRMDRLEQRMDRVEQRLDRGEQRIDRLERNLTQQLDGIDRRLDILEIEKLPARVTSLEKMVNGR
jgi:predicted  nucleic acid-binding Zn-ribbon protein